MLRPGGNSGPFAFVLIRAMRLRGLIQDLDRFRPRDGDFRPVVELDPSPDPDAFALKRRDVESRLTECPHVLGVDRHREVGTVVLPEVDEGAPSCDGRGDDVALDDLE
jgi:hypothetical protein